MRVLIVEDERRLADALSAILAEKKYIAEAVYDGRTGLDYALAGQYDVIILDVMLPGMSGFDVVKEMRVRKNATPVLLLTARDEIGDKVAGLDCGADDYMTKPFSPEELLARLRSLSRRQGDVVFEQMAFKDVTLSLSTYDLSCGARSVHLGYKEFEVMRLLLSSPGAIVTKESIITNIWGVQEDVSENNVEAYISFLRKKLFFIGSKVSIGTVRKVGYRLEAADAKEA